MMSQKIIVQLNLILSTTNFFEFYVDSGDYTRRGETLILFHQFGVQITKQQQRKRNGQILLELEAIGRMTKHDQVIAQLIRDGDVIELKC